MPSLDPFCISLGADVDHVTSIGVSSTTLTLVLALNVAASDTFPRQGYNATPTLLFVEPWELWATNGTVVTGGSQRTDPDIVDLGSDLSQITGMSITGTVLTITATLKARTYNTNPTRVYLPGTAARLLHT